MGSSGIVLSSFDAIISIDFGMNSFGGGRAIFLDEVEKEKSGELNLERISSSSLW
jgi:hypothetical protein